jgi:hypothetical protein
VLAKLCVAQLYSYSGGTSLLRVQQRYVGVSISVTLARCIADRSGNATANRNALGGSADAAIRMNS